MKMTDTIAKFGAKILDNPRPETIPLIVVAGVLFCGGYICEKLVEKRKKKK